MSKFVLARVLPLFSVLVLAGGLSALLSSEIAHGETSADQISVSVSGGVSYSNSGSPTGGDLTVAPASGAPTSVTGSVTLPSQESGEATVSFGVRRFLSFVPTVFIGNVVVSDPAAGVYLSTPVLWANLQRAADGTVSLTHSWFTVKDGFPKSYTLSWSAKDGGVMGPENWSSVPTALTRPQLSGSVGTQLTASTGTWDQPGLTFAYQWKRCKTTVGSAAVSCASVAGATSPTYQPSPADWDGYGNTYQYLRVWVHATNTTGAKGSKSSAPSEPAELPVLEKKAITLNTTSPIYGGTVTYARPQSWSWAPASTTIPSGPIVGDDLLQWSRCPRNANGSWGTCTPILGATAPSYEITPSDVGFGLQLQVVGRNAIGVNTYTSAVTNPVPAYTSCVPPAPLPLPSSADGAVFLYETVANIGDVELANLMKGARWAVVNDQPNAHGECLAAKRLAGLHVVPIHYVQWVWFKPSHNFLKDHPEWGFCAPGYSTSAVGADAVNGDPDPNGRQYPDLNIQAARDEVDTDLQTLKNRGFQGFFFDVGGRTFRDGAPSNQGDIANRVNNCAGSQPLVQSGATFAQSQLSVMQHVQAPVASGGLGLVTFMNCCGRSQLENSTNVTHGVALAASASVDYLLTENFKLADDPYTDAANLDVGSPLQVLGIDNESHGDVLAFLCAEDTDQATLSWARAKLWDQPVVVNTGFTGDPTGDGCEKGNNRWGIYPNLVGFHLGAPLDPAPRKGECESAGSTECTYSRRYQNGSVYVNTSDTMVLSDHASGQAQINLVDSGCVYVAKLSPTGAPQNLSDTSCLQRSTRNPGPKSATILIYRRNTADPWPIG